MRPGAGREGEANVLLKLQPRNKRQRQATSPSTARPTQSRSQASARLQAQVVVKAWQGIIIIINSRAVLASPCALLLEDPRKPQLTPGREPLPRLLAPPQ